MFHSNKEIKEGAVFISDAHFNAKNGEVFLTQLLQKIATNELQTPQLFLLGDIFDALFGGVPHTKVGNEETIELIEEIAKTKEVFYLEGNHDFQLQKFFSKNVNIYPLRQHPVEFTCKDQSVWLAHGDFDAPFGYMAYTKFIRNPVALFFLNIYDSLTNHSILRFVDKHMSKKEQCKTFDWFEEFSKKRLSKGFTCKVYIDGHFHQNVTYKLENIKYINLGAFACNQRFFVVKFKQNEIILEEKTLR
jgi:UDP-2,3-diacylglucosamine hydrolase